MKTVSFILVTLLSISLFSCLGDDQPTKVEPVIQDSIEVITDTMTFSLGNCFLIPLVPRGEYIIRSTSDYQIFKEARRPSSDSCKDIELPAVDFSQNSILGVWIANHTYYNSSGHYPKYIRTVTKNNILKKIIFKIVVIEPRHWSGAVEDVTPINLNLLRIPKIPDDYSVEIDTLTTYYIWGK